MCQTHYPPCRVHHSSPIVTTKVFISGILAEMVSIKVWSILVKGGVENGQKERQTDGQKDGRRENRPVLFFSVSSPLCPLLVFPSLALSGTRRASQKSPGGKGERLFSSRLIESISQSVPIKNGVNQIASPFLTICLCVFLF